MLFMHVYILRMYACSLMITTESHNKPVRYCYHSFYTLKSQSIQTFVTVVVFRVVVVVAAV